VRLKRIDPTRHIDTINFTKIKQDKMRQEVKKIVLVKVQEQALSTVLAEISGMNFLSAYLKERYPEVESILEVNRDVIEDFLVYVNTEASGRKSYRTVLHHIKSVILTASLVYERKELQTLFFVDDIPTEPYRLYKYYSDEEFKRLVNAIVDMDVQVGRMLMLHILLGTRISEALTLEQDCLYKTDSGSWMIKIKQIKNGRSYCKPVNKDVIDLIQVAIQYTTEHFGKQKYIFVTENNPSEPMQYSRVQYQIMALIVKEDLRNDNGELFGVGTHLFRHNYGKTLTEAGVDDITCAKLLGHADTHSLRYYRRTTKDRMAEETLNIRKLYQNAISEAIKEW
jgi:integrase